MQSLAKLYPKGKGMSTEIRLGYNRLVVLLKQEDVEILTESVGSLQYGHLVDDKDG